MRNLFYFFIFGLVILFTVQGCKEDVSKIQSDHIEVVMRRIGNDILLQSSDSISVVKPILFEGDKYRIQFGSDFSFLPDNLVKTIDIILKKELPYEDYLVKIEACETKEVIYSYEINQFVKFDEVACRERSQPEDCYEVVIQFIQKKEQNLSVIILIVLLTISISMGSYYYYKKRNFIGNTNTIKIGEYLYDAKKMILIRKEKTIELTSKESELLSLLYESANETVERDIILNKVWGDEGGYVGRTLDVYISKLRKKLDNDASVQLKNIRGIGYKLIIED